MKLRKKTIWRLAFLTAGLVLAAGLVAPMFDAGRFGGRVRESLRLALGREVEIGKVHLDLFNGPGFSVDDVVIHEDPRIGLEPFAYVGSLEARVSFISFLRGRLEFSKLRLVNPQVNLTRSSGGGWSFERLLTRTAGAAPARVRLPEIQVRGGRINFKLGDTKSVFYITDASLDAAPPRSPGGRWRLRFEGQPARTDRLAYGFGTFTARGSWRPDARSGGDVDLSLDLNKGSLADLMRLVRGHDIGVHGQVTSNARLTGPVSDVRIEGRMQIGDIHRWDLMPGDSGGWPLNYRGRLDLVSQTLDLETAPPSGGDPLPVSFRVRGAQFLSDPAWGVQAIFHALPLAPLPELGRHMGLALPQALVAQGSVTGVLGYSPGLGVQGKLAALDTELRMPDSPVIRLARAELVFEGPRTLLAPAAFTLPAAGPGGGASRASLQGVYIWKNQSLDVAIVTPRMTVPAPQSAWARLLSAVPLVRHCRTGSWRGHLNYHQQADAPGFWAGTVMVENTEITAPGFADPFRIAQARIVIRPDDATLDRITSQLGAAEIRGEYRYIPKADRPHQFKCAIAEMDAAELERLLLPSVVRTEGFLSRALSLGRSRVPDWMAERRADGTIQIRSLQVGDVTLADVRAHVRWDGPALEIPDVSAQWGDGLLSGSLSANLGRPLPVYRLNGRFRSLVWMGAQWDGKGLMETSGAGADLLRNMRLEGSFRSRSGWSVADNEFKAVSGNCLLTVTRGLPQFQVLDLQAMLGSATYRGKGATGADGRFSVELTDGQKQLRLTGALWPFQLSPG